MCIREIWDIGNDLFGVSLSHQFSLGPHFHFNSSIDRMTMFWSSNPLCELLSSRHADHWSDMVCCLCYYCCLYVTGSYFAFTCSVIIWTVSIDAQARFKVRACRTALAGTQHGTRSVSTFSLWRFVRLYNRVLSHVVPVLCGIVRHMTW